ncbi:MAG: hypothetical protein ACI9BF_000008 [Candidatus Paceibacteria bacterium]|jgi:hypothetical protein
MAAVKKIFTKSSTKLVKKTPAQKPVAVKTSASKISNRSSPGAASERKPVTKKTTLKKKPLNKNRKISRIKKVDSVSLPNNMSLRAVEKTFVFKREFDKFLRQPMYRIAYVAGLSFVLVGSFFAVSHIVPSNLPYLMLGQLATNDSIDTTSDSILNSSTDLVTTEVAVPNPTFKFISNIPDEISDDLRMTFIVTNAEMVSSRLARIGHHDFSSLKTTILSDNKYRVNISVANLPDGIYNLKIYVKPLNGNNGTVFESREFSVVNDSFVDIADVSIISGTEDGQINLATGTESTETGTTQLLSITPDYVVENQDVSRPPDNGPTIATTNDTDDDSTTEKVVPPSSSERSVTPFALFVPDDSVLNGVKTVKVSALKEYLWIELYARPIRSLDTIFVARAVKRSGEWYFVIDSTNLPNGKYEFTAKTDFNNSIIKTRPILVLVENSVKPYVKETVLPDVSVDTEKKEISVRELPPKLEDQNFVPTVNLDDDVKRETDDLLVNNVDDFNTLFRHYATAQQSGDEMLIRTAKEALEEKRKALVTITLHNERLRYISDNIDEELTLRVIELEEKINVFEKIRREKSQGKTAIDTDKDGISDFDEIHLYNTNPEAVDTDNDGITDGIEIMRGYNPNNAAPEAIVEFESPRETVGLLRDDVLTMKEVLPVIQISDANDAQIVKTEIRGKGLPNSFVTLYIYSTPTVVTIRTDADGEFVYTFDKELEDGQHDIYIAMTDNAGEIIAQSSPFSFFKQAQAFTVVNDTGAGLVTSDSVKESVKSSYSTVVGMGILALGLILLMLGMTLRPKNDDLNEDSDYVSNPNADRVTFDDNKHLESS